MKSYKLWAVLAAVLLVLGVVLYIFGISLGGRLHDSFTEKTTPLKMTTSIVMMIIGRKSSCHRFRI